MFSNVLASTFMFPIYVFLGKGNFLFLIKLLI